MTNEEKSEGYKKRAAAYMYAAVVLSPELNRVARQEVLKLSDYSRIMSELVLREDPGLFLETRELCMDARDTLVGIGKWDVVWDAFQGFKLSSPFQDPT